MCAQRRRTVTHHRCIRVPRQFHRARWYPPRRVRLPKCAVPRECLSAPRVNPLKKRELFRNIMNRVAPRLIKSLTFKWFLIPSRCPSKLTVKSQRTWLPLIMFRVISIPFKSSTILSPAIIKKCRKPCWTMPWSLTTRVIVMSVSNRRTRCQKFMKVFRFRNLIIAWLSGGLTFHGSDRRFLVVKSSALLQGTALNCLFLID